MRMVSGKSEPSKIIINFQYKLILVAREYEFNPTYTKRKTISK